MLPVLAARAAAVLLVCIAAFQVALVFGAPWGAYTQEARRKAPSTRPDEVLAAASCVLLLVMAAAILARVGQAPLENAPGGPIGRPLAWFT